MKTILVTGSTDGIGFALAKKLLAIGHMVILHGRSVEKLDRTKEMLSQYGQVDGFVSDLSKLSEVSYMANQIKEKYTNLDVLVNNAGVLKASSPKTKEGFDIRFVVNTFAPYLLTHSLLPIMNPKGRIINLSSAAQAPVNTNALLGKIDLEDFDAYAQSKLAITMWSSYLATELSSNGPTVIAVNPGSLLGSKMVKEGFGMDGKDINIGADILARLALEDKYSSYSGKYFDNDSGRFASPHQDALSEQKVQRVVDLIKQQVDKSCPL